MGQRYHLDTEEQQRNFQSYCGQMRLAGKRVCVEFVNPAGTRSAKQNASMHLWFRQLAQCLNDAGFSVMKVMKHDAEIDWTEHSVKELLWHPIQQAMTGKTSTTEASKLEVPDIYDTLSRHLAQSLGIVPPPWPQENL